MCGISPTSGKPIFGPGVLHQKASITSEKFQNLGQPRLKSFPSGQTQPLSLSPCTQRPSWGLPGRGHSCHSFSNLRTFHPIGGGQAKLLSPRPKLPFLLLWRGPRLKSLSPYGQPPPSRTCWWFLTRRSGCQYPFSALMEA